MPASPFTCVLDVKASLGECPGGIFALAVDTPGPREPQFAG